MFTAVFYYVIAEAHSDIVPAIHAVTVHGIITAVRYDTVGLLHDHIVRHRMLSLIRVYTVFHSLRIFFFILAVKWGCLVFGTLNV